MCVPQHHVLTSMCSCACATIKALPFLLRAGDEWTEGLRADMRELLGQGPLEPLPQPLWPARLQQPSAETLAIALERAAERARLRLRAAAEWVLQQQARLERARSTPQEAFVRSACTAAADEAEAAAAWASALESGRSPERVPISSDTAWAARYGTQGPRLEQAEVRRLLRLGEGADDTDQVLAAHRLLCACSPSSSGCGEITLAAVEQAQQQAQQAQQQAQQRAQQAQQQAQLLLQQLQQQHQQWLLQQQQAPAPAAQATIQLTLEDVTRPNTLPQKEAWALAAHMCVPAGGRKMRIGELCEHLRDNWPRCVTDGGAISFPAIILRVPLPVSRKYIIT